MRSFIAYGHKLYSHTHSYIHYGYLKAFKELGWTTEWIDENDKRDASTIQPGTVFLTEGQVDKGIPIRSDCFYLLHHVKESDYKDIPETNKVVLQVNLYGKTHDGVKLSDVSVYNLESNTLYTIWATDLLPNEIDINSALQSCTSKKNAVIFIGSINNCSKFGNHNQITPFVQEAQKYNYEWINFTAPFSNPVENTEQQKLIASCKFAPAIVGHWQQEQGYIPCRIFKTISYGSIGITNSKYVQNLFKDQCIFHENSQELFKLANEYWQQPIEVIHESLKKQMEYVRDYHTYINRSQDIIKLLHLKLFQNFETKKLSI